MMDFSYITENYKRIAYNIGEAKAKYRKPDEEIRLMAVTKTVLADAVNYAIDECGINLLGENRVQEYLSKKELYRENAEVHIIGHLQSNKVKYIIDSISLIQSVDSLKLAEEINRHAMKINKIQNVLIEINIGGEDSKSGISAKQLTELIENVSALPNVRIKGLMTIPPVNSGEKFLAEMHELYLDIRDKNIDNVDMDILSMGMSGDYELAIKHGSNLVRIGTALFGARNYSLK